MKKVLIAVNSETLREALAALLCREFEVRICCHPEQMIHQQEQWHPDAMVLDLTSTGTVYRNILQECAKQHTPFVVLTPFLGEDLLREAEQAKNARILRVPCSANAIASHVRKLLTSPVRQQL